MKSADIREKFLKYFEGKGHKIVPSSSLIPEADPSVLLTTAGMQQFKPYYTGALDSDKDPHPGLGEPLGSKNVASIQKSFRTSDIDEVGDNTHLTFFEMLGNFSFGGYGKKEAMAYAHEFVTKIMGLNIDYVSVFGGESEVPEDKESEEIWRKIDAKIEVRKFGRADNFWGPTGDQGPCGPTTEIYVNGIEIWNIVFNEFYQDQKGQLSRLDTLGVDTGMGLERLALVAQNAENIFATDLFDFILKELPDELSDKDKRIVADHARATVFLICDGVMPSNKEAGYILRRLMRRVMVYENLDLNGIFRKIIDVYGQFYPELKVGKVEEVFGGEQEKFKKTLGEGLKQLAKLNQVDAKSAFYLYETYGLPYEVINDKVAGLKREEFEEEFKKHQELSRTASAGVFKGGLVDHEPKTVKHHTAHHLLLAALRQVLGEHVFQRGSNVSSARLRLDFSHGEKLTPEQLKQVEELVNQKIAEGLKVERDEMPKEEAEKLGALAEFGAKYGDIVSVYTVYNRDGTVFSREFCGGPHVTNTSEIGKLKIIKEEASSAGVRRIKAAVA